MARARNIKPSFFKNEQLAELPFETRLLFIGLWTLADREGRFEDRPKRIRMEIFPADDVDVDVELSKLSKSGFITRYTIGESRFIEVCNFTKHQNPHHKEASSTIPKPQASTHQSKENKPVQDGLTVLVTDSLIPDSLNLIPDSKPILADPSKTASEKPDHFEELRKAYPRREGDNRLKDARIAYKARLKEGHTEAEILAGVVRYASWVRAKGKEGTEYVKQLATFLGTGKAFLEKWEVGSAQAERSYSHLVDMVKD